MGPWGVALPVVPLVAALLGLLLPRGSRRVAAALGILGAAAALAIAVVLVTGVGGPLDVSYPWASFGRFAVTIDIRLDPAAVAVAVAVGVVALAVQVYSVAYLHDDDRYAPYAAQISLFTAAMLTVVVAGDLIMLLVGWEVMGICSYLLIGHDRRLPEAPAAAVKAFLVTRVGDVGFLLAIVVMAVRVGSFRLADILAPGALDGVTLTVVCLLLLAGVAGKSAQFPLHTWLPDAMAGPTPISALIHAATMVAAGVYVVARLFPLFDQAPVAMDVLAIMSMITMLLGACAALAQDDIKRVLAWSTVSQIAYMMGALAVRAPGAALFHLLTHAAFKALLFLAAGAVIHAVGTNLMSEMGGLRRRLPVTFWCTTIGLAALIGLPPMAGFWSKEAVLHEALNGPAWRGLGVYGAGLATVFLTAAYATRLWLRTFFGPPRTDPARAVHAAEPPAPMLIPVIVLAVPSLGLGLLALWPGFAERLQPGASFHQTVESAVPILWAVFGFLGTWWLWQRRSGDPARVLGRLRPVFATGFYGDAIQNALVVRPVRELAQAVRRDDESLVDGAAVGAGRLSVGAGGLLAAAHRTGLPRAVVAVLGGTVLLVVAIAVIWP